MSDLLPFSSPDAYTAARKRALDERSRMSRAFMASDYAPYAQLGQTMAQQETQASEQARQDVARQFAEHLQASQEKRAGSQLTLEQQRFTQQKIDTANQLALARWHAQLLGKQYGVDQPGSQMAMPPVPGLSAPPPPASGPPSPQSPIPPPGAAPPGPQTALGNQILPGLPPLAVNRQPVADALQNIAQLDDALTYLRAAPGAYGKLGNQAAEIGAGLLAKVPGASFLGPQVKASINAHTLNAAERVARDHIDGIIAEISKRGGVSPNELPTSQDNAEQAKEKLESILIRNINIYRAMGGQGAHSIPVPGVDPIVEQFKPK